MSNYCYPKFQKLCLDSELCPDLLPDDSNNPVCSGQLNIYNYSKICKADCNIKENVHNIDCTSNNININFNYCSNYDNFFHPSSPTSSLTSSHNQWRGDKPGSELSLTTSFLSIGSGNKGNIALRTSLENGLPQCPLFTPKGSLLQASGDIIKVTKKHSRSNSLSKGDDRACSSQSNRQTNIKESLIRSISYNSLMGSDRTFLLDFKRRLTLSKELLNSHYCFSDSHIIAKDTDYQNNDDRLDTLLQNFQTDDNEFVKIILSCSLLKRNCLSLYNKGYSEKLFKIIHGLDERGLYSYRDQLRQQSQEALKNIMRYALQDDPIGLYAYKLISKLRFHCNPLLLRLILKPNSYHERNISFSFSTIPTNIFHQINKLSCMSKYIYYLSQFGALYAIGEFLVIDLSFSKLYHNYYIQLQTRAKFVLIKRLIYNTLRNLTYRESKNKILICLLPEVLEAIVMQLECNDDELINSAASLIRNLSWKAGDVAKVALNKCNCTLSLSKIMSSPHIQKNDAILSNITSCLANLTKHSPSNKIIFCATPFAIPSMIKLLSYRNINEKSEVLENISTIFCNVSNHIANMPDHLEKIQELNTLKTLVTLLPHDNEMIQLSICGVLANLSGRSIESINSLWDLNVPRYLNKLKESKNLLVRQRAETIFKNLFTKKQNYLSEKSLEYLMGIDYNYFTPHDCVTSNSHEISKDFSYNVETEQIEHHTQSEMAFKSVPTVICKSIYDNANQKNSSAQNIISSPKINYNICDTSCNTNNFGNNIDDSSEYKNITKKIDKQLIKSIEASATKIQDEINRATFTKSNLNNSDIERISSALKCNRQTNILSKSTFNEQDLQSISQASLLTSSAVIQAHISDVHESQTPKISPHVMHYSNCNRTGLFNNPPSGEFLSYRMAPNPVYSSQVPIISLPTPRNAHYIKYFPSDHAFVTPPPKVILNKEERYPRISTPNFKFYTKENLTKLSPRKSAITMFHYSPRYYGQSITYKKNTVFKPQLDSVSKNVSYKDSNDNLFTEL